MRIVIMLMVLAVQGLAWAAPCTVGKVVRLVGKVEIQRTERRFAALEGQSLCRGDSVHTAVDAIAELRLRDGTLLTVGKDSSFVIRDFRIYRERPNVALFELTKGAFRSITGFITRRSHRFEVRTAVGTIGVRGTDFWGGFGLSEQGLDVVMLDGHGVYVQTPQGQVELTQAGQGTTAYPGQAPSAAKTWGEAKLKRAFATVTP